LAVWSLADSVWLFYAAAAGVGALQAATLYDAAFAVIARRSGPARARGGITALTLWGGFASTVFIPIVQVLLDRYGWRGALQGLAAVNVVLCAGIYFAVIDPAQDSRRPAPPPDEGTRRPAHLHLALRSPVFWWLAISFTAFSGALGGLLLHFYPMLLERGFSEYAVVLAMGLIGPAQVAGRVLIMAVGRKASGRRIGATIALGFPVAMALFAWAPPELWIVGSAAVLYGATNGIMTIVRGVAVPEMVSAEAYGAINGALALPMTAARALAPLGAAALWSATGNYNATMAGVFCLSVVMVLAFWVAAATSARGRRRAD
jgi:predicted MFS family arabinose efflux permease